MSALCIVLGTGCILYYAILAVYAGPAFNFGWFWLALGGAFLLVFFLRRHPEHSAMLWASRILLVCLGIGLAVLGVLSIIVIGGMKTTASDNVPAAIVLGAQVRGTKPSRALLKRLEAAAKAAKNDSRNQKLTLILSGGQGPGEEISEAICMRNYLTAHGIGEGQLLIEDKSTTTQENLQFSNRLYGCAKQPCAIITNDFHLCRALKIAKNAGYEEVYGIAAEGDSLMEVHYVVREAVALLYGKLRGQF